MAEEVSGPTREEALLAFSARMMWVAERSLEVAGKPAGEMSAGIAGMAVSCGVSPDDFLKICMDRMEFDEKMRSLSGLSEVVNG